MKIQMKLLAMRKYLNKKRYKLHYFQLEKGKRDQKLSQLLFPIDFKLQNKLIHLLKKLVTRK